jgi:hypothetical protein
MIEEQTVIALKGAVGKQLNVGLAHLSERFDRLACTIAAAAAKEGEQQIEYGVQRLGEMTVRDLCLVLAEGPDQQARALMLPEEVDPCAH